MPKTNLYDRHVQLKGRMVTFAGWELPVQYPTGPIVEHNTVRNKAGLFDIDHMGQVVARGPGALDYLQYLLTYDVSRMVMHEAHYSLACYEDGGIVDDLFVYKMPDRYFIAINASNTPKDAEWFQLHTHGFDVSVENVSESTYMLALQGPLAASILQPLTPIDLSKMSFHTAHDDAVAGVPTLIARSGYTGEDGFELFFPADKAPTVWDAIMAAGQPHGLLPIGLAARDSLRFEPCMPLYGQEIGPDITPLEAGLSWAVSFKKGPFIGREALLKVKFEGSEFKLVAFEMVDKGVPRHEYQVVIDGEVVGEVTTGMFSPSLLKYVGLAYVPTKDAALGTQIDVLIRDELRRAVVVKKPFYTPAYRR
jgi:aminomethyltransferase